MPGNGIEAIFGAWDTGVKILSRHEMYNTCKLQDINDQSHNVNIDYDSCFRSIELHLHHYYCQCYCDDYVTKLGKLAESW